MTVEPRRSFDPFAPSDAAVYEIRTAADGPVGSLPLTDQLLRESPSGDLFGLSQNVGMGWSAAAAADRQVLILSTQGGVRAPDGSPIALGYHTGHWEIGLLVQAAAEELRRLGTIPFAGSCPIATTPRSCSAGSRGRCRCGPASSASPPATRVSPR